MGRVSFARIGVVVSACTSSAMRWGTKSSTEKLSLPTAPTPSISAEMRQYPRAAVLGMGKG